MVLSMFPRPPRTRKWLSRSTFASADCWPISWSRRLISPKRRSRENDHDGFASALGCSVGRRHRWYHDAAGPRARRDAGPMRRLLGFCPVQSAAFAGGAARGPWRARENRRHRLVLDVGCRREVELKARFPRLSITVLNRGVGGEEVPQMLARFAEAVIAEKPDLVIWQLGTNAVLRGHDVGKVAEDIHEGVARLKAIGIDVILIDLQFAPRVIEKADAAPMVGLISAVAKRDNVDLFRRFAVMREWSETRHVSFQQSLAPDGLHMNDWSYSCMAKLLASAIADAATRIPQSAGVSTVPTAQR